MKDIKGKTAFITGAASGIGFGMAEAFANAGMKVVIADIEQGALEERRAALAGAGAEILALTLDVTDRAAMIRAADAAEAAFGPIHVVCNNAGVTNRGPLDTATYDDWDWVMGVNFGGVVNGLRTFVPRIKAHGEGGHMVNTASIAGLLATPGNGVYAASKTAVVAISEVLHAELAGHNIGVSVLCPGLVDTQINHAARNRPGGLADTRGEASAEQTELLDRSLALGARPREIGEAVLRGVQAGALYILPHSEFKQPFRRKSEAILAAFSAQPPTPERLEGMDIRRQGFAKFWDGDGAGIETGELWK